MSTTMNGKPRKQLADQLDRLDGVIDLLADNLNQAVADAAKDGVRDAVQTVARELLADPAVRALIAGLATSPPATLPTTPSRWSVIRASLARLKTAAARRVANAAGVVREQICRVARTITAPVAAVHAAAKAVAMLTSVATVRSAVLAGGLVGATVAAIAVASPMFAAGFAGLVSGVAAATAKVAFGIGRTRAA